MEAADAKTRSNTLVASRLYFFSTGSIVSDVLLAATFWPLRALLIKFVSRVFSSAVLSIYSKLFRNSTSFLPAATVADILLFSCIADRFLSLTTVSLTGL